MHPAIPKSLLPDQVPPGLQLGDGFRCKPLEIYDYFSILGDGKAEGIWMKKYNMEGMKGGQFTFGRRIRSKDRVADKDFASDPLFFGITSR